MMYFSDETGSLWSGLWDNDDCLVILSPSMALKVACPTMVSVSLWIRRVQQLIQPLDQLPIPPMIPQMIQLHIRSVMPSGTPTTLLIWMLQSLHGMCASCREPLPQCTPVVTTMLVTMSPMRQPIALEKMSRGASMVHILEDHMEQYALRAMTAAIRFSKVIRHRMVLLVPTALTETFTRFRQSRNVSSRDLWGPR